MKHEIKNYITGAVIVVAEIDCPEDTPTWVKDGLAVRWAVKSDVSLREADLRGAKLVGATLHGADFSGADLSGAALRSSILVGANFCGACLVEAVLADANLFGADLIGVNLCDAVLSNANLVGTNLYNANMYGANLKGANLHNAILGGADLGRTDLVDGGQRSDGGRFVGWVKDEELHILAERLNFEISDARVHWAKALGGSALGVETMDIINHIETVAKTRGLVA